MNSLVRGGGRLPWKALALALGIGVFGGGQAALHGGEPDGTDHHGHGSQGAGTLGWAPYGLYPGFYGFGLSYHLGYGYGGDALGVGADGGYPFYGGPGYLHPGPPLRRFGHLIPFAYYSGPGYPLNFDLPGRLVVTAPVAMQTTSTDPGHAAGSTVYPYDTGYGPFTGALDYPESFFAPYTAAAAASGSSAGVSGPSPYVTANADRVRDLGIDEEPVVDVNGARA